MDLQRLWHLRLPPGGLPHCPTVGANHDRQHSQPLHPVHRDLRRGGIAQFQLHQPGGLALRPCHTIFYVHFSNRNPHETFDNAYPQFAKTSDAKARALLDEQAGPRRLIAHMQGALRKMRSSRGSPPHGTCQGTGCQARHRQSHAQHLPNHWCRRTSSRPHAMPQSAPVATRKSNASPSPVLVLRALPAGPAQREEPGACTD